ncbi:MAG: type IV pilus assembly protein PilM [Armatimonadetes bacterium]|nr:type IV pilus assembly protein PilM [Armatimonadota bacterium]MBX3108679.1 type IV pilus assembly protein PilM [Fimbriimonadaceae bacterium]
MSLNPFKKRSYVGIDIGHKTINLVQLEKVGHGWKVSRQGMIPTPSDSVKDGVVIDPDVVGIAIKGALREFKISASSAVVAVSGASVIVRMIKTAKMTPQMLRKSIRYEAGHYVPSSIEDSYIEFEILGETEDGQLDVMIVAAPREVVESKKRAVERADLEVDIVDIEAFAIYRSLIEADENSVLHNMTVAIVDVGAAATTVSVVSDGKFMMTRTIVAAGQAMTDALKSYFQLNDEQAEIGKSQLDFTPLAANPLTDNPPLKVVQGHVDDLAREIRRSIGYFQTQQAEGAKSNPVTHILLTGGGAKLRGLGEYMSSKLGAEVITTGIYDNPKFIPIGDLPPGKGLEWSVATGLAMRAFMKAA